MNDQITLGRCRVCGGAHRSVNADGLCLGCEFVQDVTAAFPATESYTKDGVTVVDMSRAWGKS